MIDYLEIRNQAHLMWAEGTADGKPTHEEISTAIRNEGYNAENIDVFWDELQSMWRFNADITEIK